MELENKKLHGNQEVGRAFSQITLDDDYNLPDYKPDLTKVIRERGTIRFEETHVSSGHVWLKGVLSFSILYRTDLDNKKLNQLQGEIPFQESLAIDGVEEHNPVKVEGKIEDISVSVINSRKLSIRSLVEFTAAAKVSGEEKILTGIKEENSCEMLKETLEALELITDKKDTLRIRKELSLSSNKPNMEEILWSSVELRGMNSKPKNGEIEVTGEALIYVLYAGAEEEAGLQWFETTVPIHGGVECSSCETEQIYWVKPSLEQWSMEIRPDEDGEERNLMLEMVVQLEIGLWREESIEMISDIYALDKQIKPEFKTAVFHKLWMKNEVKCKIADKIELLEGDEDILQICVNEETLNIEQTNITEDGVLAEGTLTVEILYMTSDDSMPLGAKKAYIPFQQMIEMPKSQGEMQIWLHGEIDQETTVLLDSRMIEVKAAVTLNLLAFQKQERQLITNISQEELDLKALQQSPGIVGYIVRPGDKLFCIAKEHHTTVGNLMETNRLAQPVVKPGEKLLIVKKVE